MRGGMGLRLVKITSSRAPLGSILGIGMGKVDLEKEAESVSAADEEPNDASQGPEVLEPYVGMEFDSEDAAKQFYVDYAKKVGFTVRVMQRRRSGVDGRTLARRLGCNKQGFSPHHKGKDKKPRASSREGCIATILVKLEKSGKWVVSRFVKDHNHPLALTACGYNDLDDKDKKIKELTKELRHQERLCASYRQRLHDLVRSVEDQADNLSVKVRMVVDDIRKAESEVKNLSQQS